MNRFRYLNGAAAMVHLIQSVIMFQLIDGDTIELFFIRWDSPQGTTTTGLIEPSIEFVGINIAIGHLLVLFLLLSGIAHLLITTLLWDRYIRYIRQGINPYRWIEYSITASLMIVAITMLGGQSSIGVLLSFFTLIAIMNLMGLRMEQVNRVRGSVGDVIENKIDWRPYWLGWIPALVPWVIIFGNLVYTRIDIGSSFPSFVLFATGFTFFMFNLFAVNMYLQYRGWWRWRDYLWGEFIYILLSFTAKTILAWWIYLGAEGSPAIGV